jgi:hypothetical protein
MAMVGYYIRLGAVVATAALLGWIIFHPTAGRRAIQQAGPVVLAHLPPVRACPPGELPLSGPFAPIGDILSVSPLGAVTAPGEPLPTPYLRLNTKRGKTAFDRKPTAALAPANSEITAIERRIERAADGAARASWTVHLKPCDKITVYYDRLDSIEPSILRRAGGLSAFTEIGGPEHLAIETRIRVREGDLIGSSHGFDVGLHDAAAAPAAMARPERYRSDAFERAEVFKTPPELLQAISPDISRARCALDYLPAAFKGEWANKLGDSWGMRRAKGDNACRTALVDAPGSAQGAWFTDASHNALTNKVSAVALAPDSIDPERLVFALHGRLKSLTADLVALNPRMDEERAQAAKDFLTFEKGGGLINRAFAEMKPGDVYCYEGLRANFVGPRIAGVLLVQMTSALTGAELLKIEARGDALSCAGLPEPWSFSGNETTFYR